MAIDPYQVPQSETLEKNSAKFPFVRILKNVIYIGIFLMILDVVFRGDDETKASVVTKALIVLKRRKVDFSPFIPKLLPKLLDNSSVKRSNAYSWIKKYYPEIEREITELKKAGW